MDIKQIIDDIIGIVEHPEHQNLLPYQLTGKIRQYERELVAKVEGAVEPLEGETPAEEQQEQKNGGEQTELDKTLAAIADAEKGGHAKLHELAVAMGVEVPEDVKAAWGDASKVVDKAAVLTEKAKADAASAEPTTPADKTE